VDNGSTDGTAGIIRRQFPQVRVIELTRNAGAAGRNAGVRTASARYLAFAEDDSWYEPGALRTAADLLDAHPEVALIKYVPDVRARHLPDHRQPSVLARRLGIRNTLWFAWTRRPWRIAARWTVHVLGSSPPNAATSLGLVDFLRWLPRLARARRRLPEKVEHDLALLDRQKITSRARAYGRVR
jgi:glycosyltransferase involved in cell wall biosynthesis